MRSITKMENQRARTKSVREVLPAFAIITLCFGHNARAGSNDIEQIQTLENNLAAAAEARNLDAIMKAYVPDTLFVFDVIPPREYVGAKAFRKDWEFLGSTKGPLKCNITDIAVVVVGDVAYGHSIQRIVATGVKGDPLDLTTRVTDVYRKSSGKRMIVQEHISIPVDLDTGKPDYASKP
jgi:ketosteroid isomerase-like protein